MGYGTRHRVIGPGVACAVGLLVAALKYFGTGHSAGSAVLDGVLVAVAAALGFEIVVALVRGERNARHFFAGWRR